MQILRHSATGWAAAAGARAAVAVTVTVAETLNRDLDKVSDWYDLRG